MKKFAIAAAALFVANAAMADGHAADCANMLTLAIGQELSSQGIDTSNICDLSLNDVVRIKSLLDEGGMNATSRGTIEKILAGE